MNKFTVENIKYLLEEGAEIISVSPEITFGNAETLEDSDENSLVWIKPSKQDKENLIKNSKAAFIICDKSVKITEVPLGNKVIIKVNNPKLNFLRILNALFVNNPLPEIHPASYIHPAAIIGKNVFIGAFTYVGKSVVDDGSYISGHCYIYDNVRIGKNVKIHSGTIIGSDGYGYERNESGELEKFPQIGGVVIESDVEIGANVCIDRGSLGNTLICEGAKIDNLVHIAHNVKVGRNAAVIAMSMIAGSVKLGEESWIAPSVSILNQITIGKKSIVGMGAVVTKNIPDGETWTGLPARPMKEFIEQQKLLKRNIKGVDEA
ncbi:UDP-3-O-(3-hydroxymyristoyl)glucosamine N-acyltransferase [soil metagenome]